MVQGVLGTVIIYHLLSIIFSLLFIICYLLFIIYYGDNSSFSIHHRVLVGRDWGVMPATPGARP